MRFFAADLHVHTVLSACAEPEMLPDLILQRAQEQGLNLIAATDHNSVENAAAMIRAGEQAGITVLPGMELQTREEVHLLCLFDALEQALAWQEVVYAKLPPLKNRPEIFGVQVQVDVTGEPAGYNERLLATSTSLSVEEVVAQVRMRGGLCIPAHVDRPAYSIISNLGFIPPELPIPGVEISLPQGGPKEARERFPQLACYGMISSSDAHRLRDIVRRTTLKMAEPTVAELALALASPSAAGEGERGVWVNGISSGPLSPFERRSGLACRCVKRET